MDILELLIVQRQRAGDVLFVRSDGVIIATSAIFASALPRTGAFFGASAAAVHTGCPRKRAKDERRRINRSFNAFLLDSDEEVEESAVDYDGILTVNDDGEESDDDTPEERVFDEDGCSFDVKKLSPYIFETESVIRFVYQRMSSQEGNQESSDFFDYNPMDDSRVQSPMLACPQCEEAMRWHENVEVRLSALRNSSMQVVSSIGDHRDRSLDELSAAKFDLRATMQLYEEVSAECEAAKRRFISVNLALGQGGNPWTGFYNENR
ncbi:hypothetical protein OSTOST_02559 [Ostertagia ostertagi]